MVPISEYHYYRCCLWHRSRLHTLISVMSFMPISLSKHFVTRVEAIGIFRQLSTHYSDGPFYSSVYIDFVSGTNVPVQSTYAVFDSLGIREATVNPNNYVTLSLLALRRITD